MITIRKKISRPYLMIIILMPITIMIFFNCIVAFYTKNQAEEDLSAAVAQISVELEGEIETDSKLSTNNENRKNILFPNRIEIDDGISDQTLTTNNIISIINNQRYASEAELVVFNSNGNLSQIFNIDTFVTEELADLIYKKTNNLQDDSIGTIRLADDTYYVMKVNYQGNQFADRMVYITKGFFMHEFIAVINLVLVAVLLVVTIIALFVSLKVTSAVAKPIERLTTLVEHMKTDEILIIDNTSNSIELDKLTTEINALNKRIYHYDQSQKNFLHNASHELRTPLMSIQGYADGIEMGVFQDYKGTAHLISEQSKRLTKLVESLLKLARAENFNANKKLEKLNLSDCLIDLINGYNGYAVSQSIIIKTEITPNIFTNSNVELLQGSVGNIISNGIRYANTMVTISLKKTEGKIFVIVRDDGKGVEDAENIFQRFNKGEDGDFGLGLSIAKTSIEMMGGTVQVYNDCGAVFEIQL